MESRFASVVNYRSYKPKEGEKGIVNIMRPTVWGNPFFINKKHTREKSLNNYKRWLFGEFFGDKLAIARYNLLISINRLRGKTLSCCCKPKDCHGDFLALLANKGRFCLAESEKNAKVWLWNEGPEMDYFAVLNREEGFVYLVADDFIIPVSGPGNTIYKENGFE
jgi:hypothetical protein